MIPCSSATAFQGRLLRLRPSADNFQAPAKGLFFSCATSIGAQAPLAIERAGEERGQTQGNPEAEGEGGERGTIKLFAYLTDYLSYKLTAGTANGYYSRGSSCSRLEFIEVGTFDEGTGSKGIADVAEGLYCSLLTATSRFVGFSCGDELQSKTRWSAA